MIVRAGSEKNKSFFSTKQENHLFYRVFPGPFTHGGIWGQSVNVGTHEGGHRPYGGAPNFDRLYHELKVLLMLSCNYMMRFIGYDSIKTR